jgi:nucleoside-diphosphate-sugar epimerase
MVVGKIKIGYNYAVNTAKKVISIKVLFIGGTGVISTSVSEEAVQDPDIELYLLNRGSNRSLIPAKAKLITGDIRDKNGISAILKDRYFDVVVNWVAFKPEHIESDLSLFKGRVGQYIFISSASAYKRPPEHYLVTEDTPLENDLWQYSRDKIDCEALLAKENLKDFPYTVVRPNYTYDRTMIPFIFNSRKNRYTLIDRIRKGKKIIVPGDGTSLFTITHSRDFAKGFTALLGSKKAIGEAYHITSDEVKTWDQYAMLTGKAAGRKPDILHVTSEQIISIAPEYSGGLLGDKSYSLVYDNSKLKKLAPDYHAVISFEEGIKESVSWYDKNPHMCSTDDDFDLLCDRIVSRFGT